MKLIRNLLIVFVALLLVGCTKPHKHTFVEGKCECGEVDPNYEPPHVHEFVEGKCECGEEDPNYEPPHVHEFVEGKCECGEEDPNYEPPVVVYYDVTFVDMYGEVIFVDKVQEGESANAPTVNDLTYYKFSTWDQELDEVTSNMTIKAIYTKDKTEYLNTDYRYWVREIEQNYNINEIIMTQEEIKAYNLNIVNNNSSTKVVDVLKLNKQVTKSYITNLISQYTNINKYTVYDNNNNAINSTTKQTILNNRNLNNIPDTVNVQYGIIVDFAWMRTYPTNYYSESYSKDRFQETTLNVGEEVAIYHISSDGNWYFVQAANYYGWVETKYIATSSYEEVETFVNVENFLVVISDYALIESAHVRMGQKFPLISSDDKYVISFPTRTEEGTLLLKEVTLDKNDNYHVGYLDYTYENLMIQAFKLLGIDYSWGDKEKDGRDCSSTQNGIYKSFGFVLPRNTSNQNSIPTYSKKFSSISTTELQKYAPGTLVFSSGHVMMYLGENHQGYSYILHNTTAGQGKCIIQKVNDFGINRFIALTELQ